MFKLFWLYKQNYRVDILGVGERNNKCNQYRKSYRVGYLLMTMGKYKGDREQKKLV